MQHSAAAFPRIADMHVVSIRVVKNVTIESRILFETPFSNYHDQGVAGMFGDRAKEVVEVVEQINANAEVA